MSGAAAAPLRRAVLGPVAGTAVLTVLAAATVLAGLAGPAAPAAAVGPGVLLAWLLLGLTAGYALSGSV